MGIPLSGGTPDLALSTSHYYHCVLRQTKGAYQIWALPLNDGRLLAIMTHTRSREVWMADNL